MSRFELLFFGLALVTTVSVAQEQGNSPLPEHVSQQIEKHMIGDWTYEGSWGAKKFAGYERIRWTESKTAVFFEGVEVSNGKRMSYVQVMGWNAEEQRLVHQGFTETGDTWSGQWSELSDTKWKGTGQGTYGGVSWNSPATLEFKRDWQRYEDVTDGKPWVAVYTRKAKGNAAITRLGEFIAVGSLSYEGETAAAWKGTEYGPAGKFSGGSTTRSVLGGHFLLEEWAEEVFTGETQSGIVMYGYDTSTEEYFGTHFMSNGLRSQLKVRLPDDQTMTQRFTQVSAKGERSVVRAEWKFNSDKSEFDASWELSLDDGKTWKPWLVYHGVVTKK